MRWQATFRPTSSANPGAWLAGVSAAATLAYGALPWLGRYSMHGGYLALRDWGDFALQIGLYQFLHGGVLHLLSNAVFLLAFAPRVLARSGGERFWAGFAGCALAVAGALLWLVPSTPTIGISGFCMALLTFHAADNLRTDPQEAKAGFGLAAVNVLLGLAGNVSLVGHLAGAVWGAIWWAGVRASEKLK